LVYLLPCERSIAVEIISMSFLNRLRLGLLLAAGLVTASSGEALAQQCLPPQITTETVIEERLRYSNSYTVARESVYLKEYSQKLTQFVRERIQAKYCRQDVAPKVRLFFVSRPLTRSFGQVITEESRREISLFTPPVLPKMSQYLLTPWQELQASDSTNTFQATFILNERQILYDQAMLDGVPLPWMTPEPYEAGYFGLQVGLFVGLIGDGILPKDYPERKNIPPEITWFLGRHIKPNNPFYDPKSLNMESLLASRITGLVNLNQFLVTQFLNSNQSVDYRSILEIQRIYELQGYRPSVDF
jgi:hypothetical protein